jgi:hypothetical protein
MVDKVTGLAEKLATSVGMSRRGFIQKVGHGAMTAAGAVAALVFVRSVAAGPSFPSSIAGACYYQSGGITYCEHMSQSQCSLISGSTWVANAGCAYS